MLRLLQIPLQLKEGSAISQVWYLLDTTFMKDTSFSTLDYIMPISHSSLSPHSIFKVYTHTLTPFNISLFNQVLMDISEKYYIGGWEAVQVSHSKQCLREG